MCCAVNLVFLLCSGFVALAPRGRIQRVGLARMGPKLLVSDTSTADQPFLRWQLQVRGRNACVEFGVVPETHLVSLVPLLHCMRMVCHSCNNAPAEAWSPLQPLLLLSRPACRPLHHQQKFPGPGWHSK